jgi:hypothetical protein
MSESLLLILPSQDMVEPYIWQYLCFGSMRTAHYAVSTLVESAEQLRKVSCWTCKIAFYGSHCSPLVDVHLSDSIIIVLKHAVQLVELLLPDALVTHDVLASVSAAASASLFSLQLCSSFCPDDTLSWIGEFRNLRQLIMSPMAGRCGSPQQDSDWTTLARTSASRFPELRELRFQQGSSYYESSLLMPLLGLRFQSLRRLSLIAFNVDPGMLVTFFQHQSTLESCLIRVNLAALAAALPHIACSYLTLFAAPRAHVNTGLHPLVRILHVRAGQTGIRDEYLFRLMNMIEAQRHADAHLARVHIPIDIRYHPPDDDAPDSFFDWRWHMDGPSSEARKAFTNRMRSYAARLSSRGIALVDCDGFTADGTLVKSTQVAERDVFL